MIASGDETWKLLPLGVVRIGPDVPTGVRGVYGGGGDGIEAMKKSQSWAQQFPKTEAVTNITRR